MQESQEHYFEEDSVYQAINRFEDMIRSKTTAYFDVFEFEVIVDYYLDQHNFSHAEEAINVALKQHPAAQELKYRLAQLFINSGKPSKGIRLLRNIECLESNNSDFFLLKGTALNLLGKSEEAAQSFNEAISLATDAKDDVLYNIALSYVTNRRYKQAIRYLKIAYEINSDNLDVIQELALVYERVDELENSVKYYQEYLDKDPFNDHIWYNLGITYSSMNMHKKAADAFEYATAIRPSNIAAQFSKANSNIAITEYENAIKAYQDILDVDNNNVQAFSYIGECYEKLTQYKRAMFFFKRALAIDPKFSDAWYGLGIAAYQIDQHKESVEYFHKAAELDPENPDFWFMIGEVYRKIGVVEKAAEAFNRTVELDPNDYEAWICRAEISFNDNNDIKGAIDILKKAVEYNNDNSTVLYHLATYFFCNNQSQMAYGYFEKGLGINFKEHIDFLEDIPVEYHSRINQKLVSKYKK